MSRRLAWAAALILALPAAPAAAQNFNFAACGGADPLNMTKGVRVRILDTQEEWVGQRLQRLRQTASALPGRPPEGLAGQAAALEALIAAQQEVIANADPQSPPLEAAQRREVLAAAQAGLAMVRELMSGRPLSGAQLRQVEAELAQASAAARAARADYAGDARRQRDCYRRTGSPLGQPPPPRSAPYYDMTGVWQAFWPSGERRQVEVQVTTDVVLFIEDDSVPYAARMVGGQLIADDWRGGLTATVSGDFSQVVWDNGVVWRR